MESSKDTGKVWGPTEILVMVVLVSGMFFCLTKLVLIALAQLG